MCGFWQLTMTADSWQRRWRRLHCWYSSHHFFFPLRQISSYRLFVVSFWQLHNKLLSVIWQFANIGRSHTHISKYLNAYKDASLLWFIVSYITDCFLSGNTCFCFNCGRLWGCVECVGLGLMDFWREISSRTYLYILGIRLYIFSLILWHFVW